MVKKTLLLVGVAAGLWLQNQTIGNAGDCYRGGYSSYRPTVPNYDQRYGNPNRNFYPGYGVGYGAGYNSGFGAYRSPVGLYGGSRFSSGYGMGYGPGYIGGNYGGFGNTGFGNMGFGNSWGSYGAGGFPASGSFGGPGGFGLGSSMFYGR